MTLAPARPQEALVFGAESTPPWEATVERLIVVVPPGASELPSWLAPLAEQAQALSEGEHVTIHRPRRADFSAGAIILASLSAHTDDDARRLGRSIGSSHRASATFAVTGLDVEDRAGSGFAFLSGFAEGRYRFSRYRSDAAVAPASVAVVGISAAILDSVGHGLAELEVVESSVHWCRDLTNTPPRDLTPPLFADAATREAEFCGATVRVHDEAWLAAERFAGLSAVGAGSPHAPRLVHVSYRGPQAGAAAPLVLVGKGVTFDSGGFSIKTATEMMDMKSDMAGAATVAATVNAIARLRPDTAHVVALLALAENLPGPHALRPGDVIRHRNGRTTEVVNTDCEGRLVMSDVLAWAAEQSPAAIIDIATLTYSTISALGMEITSLLGNNPSLVSAIRESGRQTGDHYWELPLWKPYHRHIESPIADLRNEESEDGAGVITAALYLQEFVGETPWAHLDTGGTAFLDEETDDLEPGATGIGTRSLIRFVLNHFCATPRSATQGGVS